MNSSHSLVVRFLILFFMPVFLLFFTNPDLYKKKYDNHGEYIVLIHGLGRTENSMNKMEILFSKKGFQVINFSYPSTKISIEDDAGLLEKTIREKCTDRTKKINFVTHSLGGIVLRYFLKYYKPENTGRVVMLSPPNKGSELIDFLSQFKPNIFIFGPVLYEISTDENSIPNRLGGINVETGIIAGDRTVEPLNSLIIPGADDGKVSVESAKLSGMKEFMVVHKAHTFIMNAPEVINFTYNFIFSGKFNP